MTPENAEPINGDDWRSSFVFRRGVTLFDAGYYWEAHEAWESLWHAHGRRGPTADLLKALIKLAAAGVKVRERQPHGIVTHARRAWALMRKVHEKVGPSYLGLDLPRLEGEALGIAEHPPADPAPADAAVSRVFSFRLAPE